MRLFLQCSIVGKNSSAVALSDIPVVVSSGLFSPALMDEELLSRGNRVVFPRTGQCNVHYRLILVFSPVIGGDNRTALLNYSKLRAEEMSGLFRCGPSV